MLKNHNALGERLRHFRTHLGMTLREFCTDLNVAFTAIGQIERGSNNPSIDLIVKMAERWGLSPTWLLTGYGEMKLTPIIKRQVAETQGIYQDHSKYPLVRIPILTSFINGGEPVPQDGAPGIVDFAHIIQPLIPHPRDTYGLKVEGDSMSPKIEAGDLVIIDTHPDAILPWENLHGKIVAARLGYGITLKWFHVTKNHWEIFAENDSAHFGVVKIPRTEDPPVVGKAVFWCPSI